MGVVKLLAAISAVIAALAAAGAVRAAPVSTVSIYMPKGSSVDCGRVFAVQRTVQGPKTPAAALRALLAGPTAAERRAGYGGWFSVKTRGTLLGVRVADGVLYANFRNFSRTIPNASTSCGSQLLLAQLDRTAKRFPCVKRTIYSFAGNRRAFYEWLQRRAP